MKRKFELAENERRQFIAPVELRGCGPDDIVIVASGETVDASVYGLGAVVDRQIPPGTEVTVAVSNRAICGTASVRYSYAVDGGFRTGLQFQVTLVMQDIPELDAILMNSLKPIAEGQSARFRSLRFILKRTSQKA